MTKFLLDPSKVNLLFVKSFVDFKGNTHWVIVDETDKVLPMGIYDAKEYADLEVRKCRNGTSSMLKRG